jgi:hypothetical protein
MTVNQGLIPKYQSPKYPSPPPTIKAATSSTPIRAARESPFRKSFGCSFSLLLSEKSRALKQNPAEMSRICLLVFYMKRGYRVYGIARNSAEY